MFRTLAEPARDLASVEAAREFARMEVELLAVDKTHPPTRFRIGFLEAIGSMPPAVTSAPGEMERIDAEFRPHSETQADKIYARLERQ
jgi:hypothetical protein